MITAMGERIRSERKRLGYTQADLGRALTVYPQAVSNWETGRTEPRHSMIRRLDGLGFDGHFILTGTRAGVDNSIKTYSLG